MQEEEFVKICPRCKSVDVENDYSNHLQSALGMPGSYICHNCGNTAIIFPEIALSELDSVARKKIEKKVQPIDTSYGDFHITIIWKISAPIVGVFGALFLFIRPITGIVFILLSLLMAYFAYRQPPKK